MNICAPLRLILFLAFGATTVAHAAATSLPELWTASVSAETSGNYDEALKQTAAWKTAGGSSYMAALRAGWLSYLKKDYVRAGAYYTEASRISPTSLVPLYGLLATSQAIGATDKIKAAAESVLRLDPSNYKSLMCLASIDFAARDYLRALSSYRRAMQAYPEDNDAMSGYAWSAFYTGSKSEAGRVFKIIVSTNPDYAYAKRGIYLCSSSQ
jgi:tetratricopeptide (TPR) repeat protein